MADYSVIRAREARKRWRQRHPEEEAARKRAYRQAKPEKNREHARASWLRVQYGLTVEGYEVMLEAQGGVCAICERPPRAGKRLAVDHDHETGRVRGLLCVPCNAALGVLELNLEKVERYLGT